jgi:hypothetical protein
MEFIQFNLICFNLIHKFWSLKEFPLCLCTLWICRMTSLVSCCARIVNQNKWSTLLHDRADVKTRYVVFEWKWISEGLLLFVNIRFCRWRSHYERGRVGITLTCFTPPSFVIFQAKISNAICRGLFLCSIVRDNSWLLTINLFTFFS